MKQPEYLVVAFDFGMGRFAAGRIRVKGRECPRWILKMVCDEERCRVYANVGRLESLTGMDRSKLVEELRVLAKRMVLIVRRTLLHRIDIEILKALDQLLLPPYKLKVRSRLCIDSSYEYFSNCETSEIYGRYCKRIKMVVYPISNEGGSETRDEVIL